MSAMIYILAFLVGLIVFICVMLPFFFGEGGMLLPTSAINDQKLLTQLKEKILAHYIKDEQAFQNNLIGNLEWKQRRQFLENRYLDIVRRLDYLGHNHEI